MAAERVVTSIDIGVPIEEAWREITKTGVLQRACFDTVLVGELKPGTPYRYETRDRSRALIRGTILEVDPPRRLALTFKFIGGKEPEARVAYELEPIPGGVRVTIVHEELDTSTRHGRSVAGGWRTFLVNLRAVLETGQPPLMARIQFFIFRLILPFLPKPKEE
jgi:uncharacterized protein YndB with AHSA1/START domain